MNNRFKEVQEAHNKLIMACVYVIIIGVCTIGIGVIGIFLKEHII